MKQTPDSSGVFYWQSVVRLLRWMLARIGSTLEFGVLREWAARLRYRLQSLAMKSAAMTDVW